MTTCRDCHAQIDPLDVFPKQRCLSCHANAPEVKRELGAMTGESLAIMWGAR
jgi:hypothetical protein